MTLCLLPLTLRSKGEFEIMCTMIVMVVDSGDICNSRIIKRDCQVPRFLPPRSALLLANQCQAGDHLIEVFPQL